MQTSEVLLVFIFGFLASMLCTMVAFYMGYKYREHEFKSDLTYYEPKKKPFNDDFPLKPGGIFAGVPSGPIQRPTAEQLKKWHEHPTTKASKEAISDSLAKDPELKKIKDEFIGGMNG